MIRWTILERAVNVAESTNQHGREEGWRPPMVASARPASGMPDDRR